MLDLLQTGIIRFLLLLVRRRRQIVGLGDLVQLFQRHRLHLHRLQALQDADLLERAVHEGFGRVHFCTLHGKLPAIKDLHAVRVVEGVKACVSGLDVEDFLLIQQIERFRLAQRRFQSGFLPLPVHCSGLPCRHGAVLQLGQQFLTDLRRAGEDDAVGGFALKTQHIAFALLQDVLLHLIGQPLVPLVAECFQPGQKGIGRRNAGTLGGVSQHIPCAVKAAMPQHIRKGFCRFLL